MDQPSPLSTVLTARLPPATARNVFLVISLSMLSLFALSWPTELSFDLWVFKDRGNLLNVDYLLDRHLMIGVDAFYAYGLLPILIQRLLFQAFGRGAWPMIGSHLAYIVLMATAWTMIIRQMRDPALWTVVVILLSPIIIWINPNFPYVLVQLSMMFALALALRKNLRGALAISAVGCWSVPTITLLFSGALLALLLLEWRTGRDRSWRELIRLLAPGALTYLLLGLLIGGFFGWRSALATALPLQGMAFYKTVRYGMFTSLKLFLYPGPAPFWNSSPLRYYICDRASWWLASSLLLFALATSCAIAMVKQRNFLNGMYLVTVLCAAIHASFVLLAYGTPQQHLIYDPILVAGVIIGLGILPATKVRNGLLGVFVGLGILSHLNQIGYTKWLWKTTHASPETANFYAHDDFRKEWSDVVALSSTHQLFLLSYGTGMHHYFPTIDTAESWTVQLGEVFDADKQRLLEKIGKADIVVEDLTGPMTLFDTDADIKRELSAMCLVEIKTFFIIWSKTPSGNSGECRSYHRELPADPRQRGEFAI
jgi:hypothetical protein